MSGRVPPHDHQAEADLLGAMLLSGDAVKVGLELSGAQYHDATNAKIHDAICALYDRGDGVDATTVSAELDGAVSAERLTAIAQATPITAHAGGYARIVAEKHRYRQAIGLGGEITQAGWDADGATLDALLTAGQERLAPPVTSSTETVELDELLSSPPPTPKPWVIPGLMLAGDVMVLTGGEGAGKATVQRQCALGVASGLHPFTGMPMRRGPVLIVDLQEDLTDIRGEMARPRRHVGANYQTGAIQIVSRRQGINLLGAHDARWFEALLARVKPVFVAMGPLKKIYQPPVGKGIWDDDVVEALHRRFDEWIVRFGFALMLEGHAGHDRDTWRVKGSSAWYAWPHFGYGLDTDPARGNTWSPRSFGMVRWRGDRENGVPRSWPSRLTQADAGFYWQADTASRDGMARIAAAGDFVDQPSLGEDAF